MPTEPSNTPKSQAPGVEDFTDALGAEEFWAQRAESFNQQGLALATRLADNVAEIARQKEDLNRQVEDAQANLDATRSNAERTVRALDRAVDADSARLTYFKEERDKARAEVQKIKSK
jgi:uncharacterized membrane protein